jgi:glycosyltransferase involved in cell wall biosynthesis
MSYEEPPCAPPPPRKFGIECVIVCDKYHDFLRHTLPLNKHLFDKIVIVTSYEDKATQRVCEYNHVQCIRTDVLESRKGIFKKGYAINVGLDALTKKDWVVHMDADILLPPQTRIILERANLDRHMIYGIDRFNVKGFKAYQDFCEELPLQHEADAYIHLKALPMATRVMSVDGGGYVPLGYWQKFCPSVSGISKYPEGHTNAGREDMLFGKLWPRAKRGMIPEIVGYHLESENAGFGSNWDGRKTAPFSHREEE